MDENTMYGYLKNIDTTLKVAANFCMTVELYKLGLISLDEFLKLVKQYVPNAPLDIEQIKKREIDKLNNQLSLLNYQEKLMALQRVLDNPNV